MRVNNGRRKTYVRNLARLILGNVVGMLRYLRKFEYFEERDVLPPLSLRIILRRMLIYGPLGSCIIISLGRFGRLQILPATLN